MIRFVNSVPQVVQLKFEIALVQPFEKMGNSKLWLEADHKKKRVRLRGIWLYQIIDVEEGGTAG